MLLRDSQSATLAHESSWSIQTWVDADGKEHVQETSFIRCKHCQSHFEHKPGSGIWHERGWCSRCHGYLCGNPLCMKSCIPWELALDYSDGLREAAVRKYLDVIRELEAQGYVIE